MHNWCETVSPVTGDITGMRIAASASRTRNPGTRSPLTGDRTDMGRCLWPRLSSWGSRVTQCIGTRVPTSVPRLSHILGRRLHQSGISRETLTTSGVRNEVGRIRPSRCTSWMTPRSFDKPIPLCACHRVATTLSRLRQIHHHHEIQPMSLAHPAYADPSPPRRRLEAPAPRPRSRPAAPWPRS